LAEVAAEAGVGVVTLLKGGCTVGLDEEDRGTGDPPCADWIAAALDYATALRPDAVYTVVTRADAVQPERLLHGVEPALASLQEAGIPILAVRDNPRFTVNMYECATRPGVPDC